MTPRIPVEHKPRRKRRKSYEKDDFPPQLPQGRRSGRLRHGSDRLAGSESEPNNRTIFKRLEESTNVHIEWTAIQSDQWGDKISLNMSNPNTLTDFIFTADFSDSNLLRYAKQGVVIALEEYIDTCMPNLQAVFEKYPEYRTMCTDTEGHIWALPWIEQLGVDKTAIQTIGNMPFINTKWLNFLGLEMPHTVDEFEQVLTAFRDNAASIQSEFGIEGSIIPMSCIVNDGDQDPAVLINGFGEGYGDMDKGRHIAVTNDRKVICAAAQECLQGQSRPVRRLFQLGRGQHRQSDRLGAPAPAGGRHHQHHPAERLLHQRLQPRPLRSHRQGGQPRPGLRLAGSDVHPHPVRPEQLGHLRRGGRFRYF